MLKMNTIIIDDLDLAYEGKLFFSGLHHGRLFRIARNRLFMKPKANFNGYHQQHAFHADGLHDQG